MIKYLIAREHESESIYMAVGDTRQDRDKVGLFSYHLTGIKLTVLRCSDMQANHFLHNNKLLMSLPGFTSDVSHLAINHRLYKTRTIDIH